ncbi:hypothetical protein GE21DRAFT_9584 [Neurospora crassa]|uniref:C2H2-type domain-containing protein n=1 Tax=Neurospora crassa (strain ATCC 24698 / 74-OR23-1A / CBS 708.71 / DSM 1257 / FGSC 987) TaxID=367110 RepID=Q7RWZ9_NEUCR|nr:hypothetical protein NCU05025 [Neurospora crassa OR74A]EAA27058.2 hypothetical protein NCU05025 [Neurospora crassa OR74A]KHE80396.1 hypothetical protein GE21DRAFT_9584 [Neurospora crassa]|eukprot:XP_956294.2 hypothetical protein NCU05025 [Neurospora crassa OR74A]
MDALTYHHADGAHEAGMALWPDEQKFQPLPANVSPLMETTVWFNPYINAQAAVGVLSSEPGFTNTLDFQGFKLEGLNTPQKDQGHHAYPDVPGETGLHESGGGDDLLNRNGVIEQPDFNTANNAQVFSPLSSQSEVPSPSLGARPSDVDLVKSPSTHGRRYICQPCSFSSNIKRDFKRHQNTRKHQSHVMRSMATLDVTGKPSSSATGWPCPVQNCKFSDTSMMFTREDNLMRHIRKEHVHGTEAKKQMQD